MSGSTTWASRKIETKIQGKLFGSSLIHGDFPIQTTAQLSATVSNQWKKFSIPFLYEELLRHFVQKVFQRTCFYPHCYLLKLDQFLEGL